MEDVRTVFAARRRFALPTLSWPRRIRWLVNCQSLADAGFGLGYAPVNRFDLREVSLTSVAQREGQLTVAVVEAGHRQSDVLTFVATPLTNDRLLALEEWRQLRTPMVLVLHGADAVLEGPTVVVTDLHRVDTRRTDSAPRHS